MDITYRTEYGILAVEPTGELEKKEFEQLGSEIAHLRENDRKFNGILIHTRDFPGYKTFSDALAHGEFLGKHADGVGKVALCTDSAVGNLLEIAGSTFTNAEVRKFDYDQRDDAEKWLLS